MKTAKEFKPTIKTVKVNNRIFYVLIYQTYDGMVKKLYMVSIAEKGYDFLTPRCISEEFLNERDFLKHFVLMQYPKYVF